MLTCAYHGWTFDLASGVMTACLTDGPDSPLCGKVRVPTYPVAERAGLVWVYLGDGEPPPVEADIPKDLLRPNTAIVGRITTRPGDWRHAAENGIDEGHGKYLHRSAWWVFFRHAPAWAIPRMVPEGDWLTRAPGEFALQERYPGIGVWPPSRFWKKKGFVSQKLSIRLPGTLRVQKEDLTNFEWYVPTEAGEHRYYQIIAKQTNALGAAWLRLQYRLYLRWVYHVKFNDQDRWVIPLMETPPERLYRPDVSVIAWRKLCEQTARGLDGPRAALTEQRAEDADELRLTGAVR
jgi:phenylpropionate dioxygenase-like ring-hydroxylating dioxygenase large terminal subunit